MDLRVALFLSAAAGLAVTPGTGTLYVVARTLRGGWREGVASVGGALGGGGVHVLAAALGGAAFLAGDPGRLRALSILGALYLLHLAVRAWRDQPAPAAPEPGAAGQAFRDGVAMAVLNPSTAVFLLAFLPQFVDPAGWVMGQMLLLGALALALNAAAHLGWVAAAARFRRAGASAPRSPRALRRAGSLLLAGLAVVSLVRSLGAAPANGGSDDDLSRAVDSDGGGSGAGGPTRSADRRRGRAARAAREGDGRPS